LRLTIPKKEFDVEIDLDDQQSAFIVLDGTDYFLDIQVAELLRNLVKEVESLRSVNEALRGAVEVVAEA
jgi:hypothetical protein|tara:strand:- start:6846 stop:7052 length:207 start_codon:yes stop_codon:yes gene_type:complete